MNICILTPRFPLPECGGDLLRINNIARYLKAKGHRLILVSYTEESPGMEEAVKLYDKVYTIKHSKVASVFYSAMFLLRRRPIQCGYYYSQRYNRLLSQVIEAEKPDLYISHLLRMVPFLESHQLQDKSIVEMTDALSKTYSLSSDAKGSWVRRMIYHAEKKLIAEYEKYVLEHYQKVVLVSQADIDFLQNSLCLTHAPMVLHTNGVECAVPLFPSYDPDKICFIGHMQSLQNQDAAIRFVEEIFPRILQQNPHAKFYIVGAHPPKNIKKLANGKNVFVTGFIDNLNTFIADACVAVAPVRVAAGIQNKVLIAMGCGIPVVLTSLIATSIPELDSGCNCFIKDDASEFAESCLALMKDKKLRDGMARKGYDMVQAHYTWEKKLEGYEEIGL